MSFGAASSTIRLVPSRPRSISLMSNQFIGRDWTVYKIQDENLVTGINANAFIHLKAIDCRQSLSLYFNK